MPQILEMAEFTDDDGMPEVQIRCGGVGAKLDVERFVTGKFFAQIFLTDEIHRSATDNFDLVVDSHRILLRAFYNRTYLFCSNFP